LKKFGRVKEAGKKQSVLRGVEEIGMFEAKQNHSIHGHLQPLLLQTARQ
jgi:hypothetical protein